MQKTTISIDIDGVLANFDQGFVKLVNKEFPEKNIPADFSTEHWDYRQILSPEEFKNVWPKLVTDTKRFWETLNPYEDNVKALARFIPRNHKYFDIYFVTARLNTAGDSAFSQTAKWLIAQHLSWYNTSLIVVKKAADKVGLLDTLGAQYSIDDYLPTVTSLERELPEHVAYLYDRPWNREGRPQLEKALNVASDLQEWLDMLECIS